MGHVGTQSHLYENLHKTAVNKILHTYHQFQTLTCNQLPGLGQYLEQGKYVETSSRMTGIDVSC